MDSGYIWYNSATGHGGGLAALNSSSVVIGSSNTTCAGPCLHLENNTATLYGGGLYLNTGTSSINFARVMNNSGSLGGGVYVQGAVFSANGTLNARNDSTSVPAMACG